MKLLKLQVVLQHMMAQHMSCLQVQPPPPAPTVKLVRDDGLVSIYKRPVRVSDLLARFPKHLVCRSDALYIGQKIPPLAAQERLKPGNCYFLLPSHCFQSALTFISLASFLQGQGSSSKLPQLFQQQGQGSVQPLDIQKAPSGGLRIRISGDFVSRLMIKATDPEQEVHDTDTGNNKQMRVCSTPQLQKDYSMLVGSRRLRCWRPKLETISEVDKCKKLKKKSSSPRRKTASSKSNKKSQLPNSTNIIPKSTAIKIRSSRKIN